MARAKKTTTKTSAKGNSNKAKNIVSNLNTKFHNHVIINSVIATLVVIVIVIGGLFVYKKELFLAANINGKLITTPQFYNRLVETNGTATFETIEREVLIEQEAKNKGITLSEEEIDEKIAEIEERFGGSEGFQQALEANNTTMEQLRDQIRIQVLVEKLFEDKASVTDKEVAKYMKDNKEFVKDMTKAQVREQLKSEKIGAEFNKWFEEAKKNATIEKYFE
jgi:foldase protein PrsA